MWLACLLEALEEFEMAQDVVASLTAFVAVAVDDGTRISLDELRRDLTQWTTASFTTSSTSPWPSPRPPRLGRPYEVTDRYLEMIAVITPPRGIMIFHTMDLTDTYFRKDHNHDWPD